MKNPCRGIRCLEVAVAVTLAGCAAPIDTSAVDKFALALAQAECDWQLRCCTDAEVKTLVGAKYGTAAECLPYQQLAQADALSLQRLGVREGRLRVDAAHAAACLQQQTSRACNPPAGAPAPASEATDCARVFVGSTAVGAECIYAEECVEGARCVSDAVAVGHGACVAFQKVGEICNRDADCEPSIPNTYCAPKDFRCHVRAKVGEPCAYTLDATGTMPLLPLLLECDPLEGAVYCDPVSTTCANLPGSGQACLTPQPPGVTSRCNPDSALALSCDGVGGAAGTCRAPGLAGADCTTVACAAGLYCAANSKCAAVPALGQPCPDGRCAQPYFCNFSLSPAACDQPAGLGQSCSTIACNVGLYCDTTCKAQLPDGAPCTNSSQCTSGDCGGNPQACVPQPVVAACTGR